MKKRLNTEGIANELRGASAFFPDYRQGARGDQGKPTEVSDAQQLASTPITPAIAPSPERATGPKGAGTAEPNSGVTTQGTQTTPRHHDAGIPRHHDTTTPRNHDTSILLENDAICEVVRKAVKQIGKEAATHRFTIDEKTQLTDIEYTYKRRGIKTSENEITRIAINYFIEDYRLNGEQSLLAKILERLNS